MKNKRIEAIFAEQDNVRRQFGAESQEMREFYNGFTKGAWSVITAYRKSKEKGFDEIVFTRDDIIWENDAIEVIDFCREAKVGWFVYGSGYSGAMEAMMSLVKAGARVGAFVIKTYVDEMFGDAKVVEVPGLRINI